MKGSIKYITDYQNIKIENKKKNPGRQLLAIRNDGRKVRIADEQLDQKTCILLLVLSVLLILVLASFFGMEVQSKSKVRAMFDTSAYSQQKTQYKMAVNNVLEEYGCMQAGIMLTQTLDINGNRQYQLHINHHHLAYLEDEITQRLLRELEGLSPLLSGSDYPLMAYEIEIVLSA